jgi:hypothetical protein
MIDSVAALKVVGYVQGFSDALRILNEALDVARAQGRNKLRLEDWQDNQWDLALVTSMGEDWVRTHYIKNPRASANEVLNWACAYQRGAVDSVNEWFGLTQKEECCYECKCE